MSTVYQKLDPGQPAFTTEVQEGEWTRQFAYGALEPTALIVTGTITQLANSYARPNCANLVNFSYQGQTAYFCDDTGFRDRRGAFQEWTREYRTLPANHNTYETYAYTFPGYYTGTATRVPYTDSPTSRIQRDFFLIGNTSLGASYATPASIPRYAPQNYAWAYRFDYSTYGNAITNVGAQVVLEGYLANTNANLLIFQSNPNLSTWQGWVSNSTEVEVAPSQLTWVSGPIWMRERRFIVAQ